MVFTIPTGIFGQYQEIVDYMGRTDGFGVNCKLVYAPLPQQISSVNTLHKRATLTPHGVNPYQHLDPQKPIETTETIVLRVYWTQKDFKKVGKFEVPDGGIMTIGNYSDLPKIYKANALLVHTDLTHAQWRFEKISEPFVHGLLNKNFVCYWRRI